MKVQGGGAAAHFSLASEEPSSLSKWENQTCCVCGSGRRRTIPCGPVTAGALILLDPHLSAPLLLLVLGPSPQPLVQLSVRVEKSGEEIQFDVRCYERQWRRELSGAINPARKQENIPQLVLCMSVCVFFFAAVNSRARAVSLGKGKSEGGGGGEGSGATHVLQRLRRVGAGRDSPKGGDRWLGLGQPEEPLQKGWNVSCPLREAVECRTEVKGGRAVCGSRPSPGRLDADQLALGKASSSEQD